MLTGFKDATGSEFKVGDLVVNTKIMDVWIVGKYSDSPKTSEYEEDCPYYFCLLNDDVDAFCIVDINKTTGFLRGECEECEMCEKYRTSFYQRFQQENLPVNKL